MADIERYQGESLIEELKHVEEAGLLFVKGYNYSEISTLLSLTVDKAKSYVVEYKKILNRQAESDPYFLEKLQFNTIKALQEFDQLSKEAWETINIATDHGMIPARIQAIKLAGELATKKAQLHKLLTGNTTDNQYIARMQKAENVNQILSKVLRDVIGRHPDVANEVRIELEIAFEIMNSENV